MPFQFAGHPKYLEAAGKSLGHPAQVVDRARRQPAVGECANLLSQVLSAHPAARREILGHAWERVAALAVALDAAGSMYDDVMHEAFPPEPGDPVEPETTPEPPKPTRTRKANP